MTVTIPQYDWQSWRSMDEVILRYESRHDEDPSPANHSTATTTLRHAIAYNAPPRYGGRDIISKQGLQGLRGKRKRSVFYYAEDTDAELTTLPLGVVVESLCVEDDFLVET